MIWPWLSNTATRQVLFINLVAKHEKNMIEARFHCNKPLTKCKIIDTKWDFLDETADKRKYNITQAHIYLLCAIEKKYGNSKEHLSLVFFYPDNPIFYKSTF